MGKQAVTEVLAGAEGTGAFGKALVPPDAPTFEAVTSPKRQRILEGTLETVGAGGYDNTSVRTILDHTGIYRQAFYDNFPDKDACYLEAFDAGVVRIKMLIEAAAGEQQTWRARLRAGLGALLDFLDAEPDIGRALIVEVHAAGAEALGKRTKVMKEIADFIDLARRETDGEPPPAIASEGVVSGIHAVVHSKLSAREDGGFAELLPEFMYFAVLPYFGSEAAAAEMQASRA